MRRRCSACRTYAAVYEAALEEAELHAITITDNSRDPGPDEPTTENIARFALDRVRAVNATISQIEDDCMRGAAGIGNNPVRAMECLTMQSGRCKRALHPSWSRSPSHPALPRPGVFHAIFSGGLTDRYGTRNAR